MFLFNRFKKDTISEPVLTLVEIVKKNRKKHDLKLIGKDHLSFVFEGDAHWRMSISVSPGYLYSNDEAKWMNKTELRYVYKELLPFAKGDQYSRQGWMQKVFPEDNK